MAFYGGRSADGDLGKDQVHSIGRRHRFRAAWVAVDVDGVEEAGTVAAANQAHLYGLDDDDDDVAGQDFQQLVRVGLSLEIAFVGAYSGADDLCGTGAFLAVSDRSGEC